MSVTGKSTLSIRKVDVAEQSSATSVGFTSLVFAHKASNGDTGFNTGSLTEPTEMSTNGFSNPGSAILLGTNIRTFRDNLKVVSSLRGDLIDYLSYTVNSGSQINFVGFTAAEGEIFTCTVSDAPVSDFQVVAATSIAATGDLLDGTTDFNVGTSFKVNANSTMQIGEIVVYRNGLIQFRNTGNSSTVTDGNYYEVDSGGGTGLVVRFNNAPVGQNDPVSVTSVSSLAEKPNNSQLAEIEKVQGQIDAMIPSLAAASGKEVTDFQAAPNNQDLKAFGDRVLVAEALLQTILSTPIMITTAWEDFTPVFNNAPTYTISQQFRWRQQGRDIEISGGIAATGTGPVGSFTLNIPATAGAGLTVTGTAGGTALTYQVSASAGFDVNGVLPSGGAFIIYENGTGNAVNGNDLTSGDQVNYQISTRVDQWSETETIAERLGL